MREGLERQVLQIAGTERKDGGGKGRKSGEEERTKRERRE